MPWAFPEFGGDANCESIIDHCKNTHTVFRLVEENEKVIAGDLAVMPGVRTLLGRKPGHIEMVIRPPTAYNPEPVLCGSSPRHKWLGQAVGIGLPWNKDKIVYVRYLGYENDEHWRDSPTRTYAKYTGKK